MFWNQLASAAAHPLPVYELTTAEADGVEGRRNSAVLAA